jgi:Zn-dependent protease
MFKRWRLGTLLGFPVEVNLSFLILLGVVFLWLGGLAGLFVVALSFSSVLLHELGHAVVARQLGVQIAGIELHFFGGAAKMIDLPKKATHEVAIALAGPAVSLMLAGAGLGLGAALHAPLVSLFGWVNAIIAGFNLIPALPMDGGRVLRALLTRKYDFVRATDISVQVATVVAGGFVLAGLAGMTQLLLLAPFLWLMGQQERVLARQMAHRYAYDRGGYVERRGGPEVVRGRWGAGGFQAAPARGGRLVIRDHRGVWVVEMD